MYASEAITKSSAPFDKVGQRVVEGDGAGR